MLGAVLVVFSILFGTNPRLKWIGYAMMPAILIACIVTWIGVPSGRAQLSTVNRGCIWHGSRTGCHALFHDHRLDRPIGKDGSVMRPVATF